MGDPRSDVRGPLLHRPGVQDRLKRLVTEGYGPEGAKTQVPARDIATIAAVVSVLVEPALGAVETSADDIRGQRVEGVHGKAPDTEGAVNEAKEAVDRLIRELPTRVAEAMAEGLDLRDERLKAGFAGVLKEMDTRITGLERVLARVSDTYERAVAAMEAVVERLEDVEARVASAASAGDVEAIRREIGEARALAGSADAPIVLTSPAPGSRRPDPGGEAQIIDLGVTVEDGAVVAGEPDDRGPTTVTLTVNNAEGAEGTVRVREIVDGEAGAAVEGAPRDQIPPRLPPSPYEEEAGPAEDEGSAEPRPSYPPRPPRMRVRGVKEGEEWLARDLIPPRPPPSPYEEEAGPAEGPSEVAEAEQPVDRAEARANGTSAKSDELEIIEPPGPLGKGRPPGTTGQLTGGDPLDDLYAEPPFGTGPDTGAPWNRPDPADPAAGKGKGNV